MKERETLYVDIPMGIDHNECIYLAEKGHVIHNIKQDLKIMIQCIPHETFHRHGLEVVLKKNITLKEALLGTTLTFHHLNGKTYNLTSSPEIICPGTRKRFPGLGMVRQHNTGDLYIEFTIVFPHTLSDAQRECIEQSL
jgi:DnaJ-class molecular chaperone